MGDFGLLLLTGVYVGFFMVCVLGARRGRFTFFVTIYLRILFDNLRAPLTQERFVSVTTCL